MVPDFRCIWLWHWHLTFGVLQCAYYRLMKFLLPGHLTNCHQSRPYAPMTQAPRSSRRCSGLSVRSRAGMQAWMATIDRDKTHPRPGSELLCELLTLWESVVFGSWRSDEPIVASWFVPVPGNLKTSKSDERLKLAPTNRLFLMQALSH